MTDQELNERFDRLESTLETMTNMMADILSRIDDKNKKSKDNLNRMKSQMELMKQAALNNPALRNNPMAKQQIEQMFSLIPGQGGE